MATTIPALPLTWRRVLVFFGVVAVAAGGGLFAGEWLDRALEPPTVARVIHRGSLLADGQRMPTVALESPDGYETTSRRLFIGKGGVAVFLSSACETCPEMIRQWNAVIASDAVPGLRVFGITNEKGEAIDSFIKEQGVRFPVYRDREQAFSIVYEVIHYPFEVIVDDDVRVRRRRIDVTQPVDLAMVRQIVAE